MNTIWMKKLYKDMIPRLPGYHGGCLILRKYKPRRWEWVNRIPVKPGMILTIHSAAGDVFMEHPERCSIAKKFFWTRGNREPAEDRIALDLFATLSKCSDVVLDIGASSGLFSLVAARSNPSAQVVAFDILPEAYHILADNLMLNGLLDRVESRLVGVGRGGRPFYAPFRRSSSQMPTSFSLYCQLTGGDRVLVPVKTLDEICLPRFNGKKMCMKIDVEGAEADIFDQGRETLRLIRPDIVCEVLRRASQVDLCDRILSEHGYKKFLISREGLRRFERLEPHERFRDWFFTTQSLIDLKIDNWVSR